MKRGAKTRAKHGASGRAKRRITGIVVVAGLAAAVAAAPARAPVATVPEGAAGAAAPVAELRGAGFLGELACYTCVGGALASTTYATAISRLFLSACLDICELVM